MSIIISKRGKGKSKADYKTRDIYKHYLKQVDIPSIDSKFESKTPLVLPYGLWGKIVKDYIKEIVKAVIEDSSIMKLPHGLGDLMVEKRKMKIGNLSKYNRLKVDYKKFRETGKIVYHLNEHRSGYRYKILWNKRHSQAIKNKSFYKYVPTRTMKRDLAYILKNDMSKDYYELIKK